MSKPNALLEGRNIKSIANYIGSADGDKKRKVVVLVRSIFDRRPCVLTLSGLVCAAPHC